MKKRITLSLFCALLLTGAVAQNQVIKANPIGLIFGLASVSYETLTTEKTALQINGTVGGLSALGVSFSQIGLGADYKFYLSSSQSAPQGFYVAPGVGLASVSITSGTTSSSVTMFYLSGVLGYQWIWDSGFALDLFGGLMYATNGELKIDGKSYGQFNGALPRLGISLGYAFGKKK